MARPLEEMDVMRRFTMLLLASLPLVAFGGKVKLVAVLAQQGQLYSMVGLSVIAIFTAPYAFIMIKTYVSAAWSESLPCTSRNSGVPLSTNTLGHFCRDTSDLVHCNAAITRAHRCSVYGAMPAASLKAGQVVRSDRRINPTSQRYASGASRGRQYTSRREQSLYLSWRGFGPNRKE